MAISSGTHAEVEVWQRVRGVLDNFIIFLPQVVDMLILFKYVYSS